MRTLPLTTVLFLAGCATSAPDTPHVTAISSAPPQRPAVAANDTPSPASGSATRAIRQLEISAFAEDENVECRKEAPTGSLIKVERCYPVGVARTAHEAALGEVARQELETMRQRQMYREQARRARDQAIRQISRQRY